MRRRTKWLLAVLPFIFLVCCAGMLVELVLELIVFGFAGWAFFLARTLSQVRWDWGEVMFAVSCFLILSMGLHWFVRSMPTSPSVGPSNPIFVRWTVSKSLAAVCLLLLFFLAGIAMVGVVHQSVWLIRSEEPIWGNDGVFGRMRSQKQMGDLAIANLHFESSTGHLPAGTLFDEHRQMLHGWGAQVLPYLGFAELYEQIDFRQPWNSQSNQTIFAQRVHVFQLPNDAPTKNASIYPTSNYASNAKVIGPGKPLTLSDISGGTSKTIMMGFVNQSLKPWGHPSNWRDPADGIGNAPHQIGVFPNRSGASVGTFALCNGSTHSISSAIDRQVLQQLSTPEDDGTPDLGDF